MSDLRPRGISPTLVFSSLGHLFTHLFTAIFFVIVVTLEQVWHRPYPELVALWTLGSLLVGAAALPAGMLGDRFGATRMMIVFFLGVGTCAIGAGLTDAPGPLMFALAGIGLFASIYHPVGIPWLVRNTVTNRGKALGVNGIFGSLGTSAAGLAAGVLIDLFSWRAAFVVPGVVSMITGVAMIVSVRRGVVGDDASEGAGDHPPAARRQMVHAFVALSITMFMAGVVYHATQAALPKTFAIRFGEAGSDGALGVGLLVALVYGVAGVMQLAGGYLADRYPLKLVYVGAIVTQVPMLWLVARIGGIPLVVVSTVMVMAGAAALPAENMLVSRYAPAHRHGLAFGVKFVLAFGAAPLAVQLVSIVTERAGDVLVVFSVLAALALVAFVAASTLPPVTSVSPEVAPPPPPSEAEAA